MDEVNGVARDYLKAPYSRVLIPDVETGTYAAKIAEFPGCVAQGDTPEEAYRNLEAAAESWIEEVLGMGERVPEPDARNRYSGRIALRLPKSLHRNAARLAEREGTSLNQFLVTAIADRVGTGNFYERMVENLERRFIQIDKQKTVVNSMMQTIDLMELLGRPTVTVNVLPGESVEAVPAHAGPARALAQRPEEG